MANKGIIAAALILALGMIASVVLSHHYQETRRVQQEQKAECAENRAALDRCLDAPYATAESHATCEKSWQPVLEKVCK